MKRALPPKLVGYSSRINRASKSAWNLRAVYFCAATITLLGMNSPACAFSDYDKGYRDSQYAGDGRNYGRNDRDRDRFRRDHNAMRDTMRRGDCRGNERGERPNHGYGGDGGDCRTIRDRDIDLNKESGANPQQTPFDDYLRRQAARENRWDHQARRDGGRIENRPQDQFHRPGPNFHGKVDFGDPGF